MFADHTTVVNASSDNNWPLQLNVEKVSNWFNNNKLTIMTNVKLKISGNPQKKTKI